ncbi:hemin uptake protein HemP [Roseobacteraceae bacterium S113]
MSEDLQKKGATPLVDPTPVYDARELITEGSQARIQLDDQMYTLRITRAGKLILTK